MSIVPEVVQRVQTLLGPLAEEVAQTVPVVKRRRKFLPATLAQTYILGFMLKPRASDEELAQTAVRCGVEVTTQAVEQRFTPTMAEFLQALFLRAVAQRVEADRTLAPLLERFPAVDFQDSTSIRLPDELSEQYPGCGGSYGGGKAALKLQIRHDLKAGGFSAVAIEAGRHCDQRSSLQFELSAPGSLRVADLGYFDTEVLQYLKDHDNFWISRLAFGTEIATSEGTPIAQIADLFAPGATLVDREILLGKDAKIACRIVAWRVPPEVANRRRQKLLATAREKGNPPPSRKRLDWCDWTIFVTNVPADRLSAEEITVLYRARWQIELMFKRWKSQNLIDEMTGSTVARKLVRFWSRLLAMLVQHWILQATAWGDRRCSLHKAWKAIQESATVLASARGVMERLIEEIETLRRMLAKTARRDKRKEPGTFELLDDPSLLGWKPLT